LGTSKSRRMGLPLMAHGKNGDLTMMAHWDSRGMSYLYLSIASKTIHLGG
jgi:2-succinyl-5-enolpyruvyl-6-hydroxy-3-cyclohexene-1-carboxylate synthase